MLGKLSLRNEIIIALAVKLLLLYGLWALCFSHPIEKQMTDRDIQQHIVSIMPVKPGTPSRGQGFYTVPRHQLATIK